MDVIPIKVPIEIYDAKQQKLQQAEVSIEDNCPMCHKAGKPVFANGCMVRSFNEDEKPQIFTVWYCTNCKNITFPYTI